MAFFQLILKARKIEKLRRSYEDEKMASLEISKDAKPRFTLKQRLRRRKLWLKKKVKRFFSKVLAVPKDTWTYKKIVAIYTDGTLENYIAKSLLGFIGGILLTYIFFVFFVFQLHFKLSSATFLCTLIGAILTLGLAFSFRVRCIVFLLLPQFFSKRGRQALMAYAFILALSGPIKNTLHNTGVLSESLACAQEQLKEAVKTVVDLAKQPFYALREAISKVIRAVKVVVKKIKQTLIAIKRVVLSILKVIVSVFQWLGSVINMCNKKLGTPFDRCQAVFDGAVADCKAKLGPIFGLVCNITYVVSTVCYIVKPLDFICMLVSYIADSVVGAVRSKIKKFAMHMKAMFYVKIKFSHSFHFETNQSKTIGEVSASITTEIRERTDKLFGFFDWMSFLTSFFTFFILLRVLRYRYKWLTSERFDNRYITNDLRTIDLIRARQDKETVLPLNPRERNKFASLNSIILIKSEKTKLAKSAIFLGLATVKLIAYISIDYSLYWVLNTIQLYGRFQSKVERPNVVTIHVSGNGYLSDLYRSIVKAFTPQGKETEIDTLLCLPDPVPPDLDKYTQIISLIIFCWIMAIFEPYGLRIRHVVMCQYYPDRAKQRAAWLYNHIIRSRGSFLKFARRQLRRKFGLSKDEKIERVTLKERLWAKCRLLNVLFPMKEAHKTCLLCGVVERSDSDSHVKCPTPGCVGLFCTQCFADLQNLCTICRSPMEYGDLSDMSEEKDSSEDQFEMPKEKMAKPEVKEEEAEMQEEDEQPAEEDQEVTEPDKDVQEEEETEAPEEEMEMPWEEEKEVIPVKKDAAEQADDKYPEDLDRSTESVYSYTYQDESPEEVVVEKHREPFRDVEAQKIRDDVTIQIFNEPFIREPSSSSESPTSCFVVRARRKIRAKFKKPPYSPAAPLRDSDSSTSIADTESWSSEEVDEEEVIHIEVDDGSDELLPKDRKDKGKLGRINRIVSAVARIPWLGKAENDEKACRGLKKKRPSLMSKIVSMLHKKRSMPVQSYRRTRKLKDSSSSSCSCDDENEILLSTYDKEIDDRYLTRRRISRKTETEDDESDENLNVRAPREKRFATKRLPRYLESTVKGTCYFEVDETESSRPRKYVRPVEDINELSDTRLPVGVKQRHKWNITEDAELGPRFSTSENTFETSAGKDIYSLGMSTISEQTDSTSRTVNEPTTRSETVSKSDTNNTKEMTSRMNRSKRFKNLKDDFSEYEASKDLAETEEESTELLTETPEKGKTEKMAHVTEENVKRPSVRKQTKGMIESTKQAKDDLKMTTKIESIPQEETVTIYTDTDTGSSPLHDPLAGLELYGVGYTSRKKVTPTRRQIIVKKETTQSEVQQSEEKSRVPEEKPRVSEAKSKAAEAKLRVSEEKPRTSKLIPRVSEEKPSTSKQIPRVSEEKPSTSKLIPRVSEEKPSTSKQIPRFSEEKLTRDNGAKEDQVDKEIDLPDISRSTQTKSRKRDSEDHRKEDAKISNTRKSGTVSKEYSKEDKGEKKWCSKRKHRKRRKRDRVKRDVSKRRKCSCSEKSTLTDDEEIYVSKRKSKSKGRSQVVPCAEEWDPCENVYSTQECECYPQDYGTDICRSSAFESPREIITSNRPEVIEQRFEIPVVKKYLPMYQSPELIEELKRHDRMRLIQESEARRRGTGSSFRSSDSTSVCSKTEDRGINRSAVPRSSFKAIDEEDRLPYQETQAYRRVLHEFQKTIGCESCKRPADRVALMRLSQEADKSKRVKQLYPVESQRRRRTDAVKKFAHKIVAPFMPTRYNRHKCKTHRELQESTCCDCSYDPEILSDVSSTCSCTKMARKSEDSTSADETTDNNE